MIAQHRLLVAKVAVPAFNCPMAKVVALSRKVTMPGAGLVVGPATVTSAVKTTLWPLTAGFAGELTAVLVTTGWTNCEMAMAVLGPKLASPLYNAVMVCVPAGRLLVA